MIEIKATDCLVQIFKCLMDPELDKITVSNNLAYFVMRKQNMIKQNIKTKSSLIISIIETLKKMTYETSRSEAYAQMKDELKNLNN